MAEIIRKKAAELPGSEGTALERAQKRAAELRERGVLDNDGKDKFHIDASIIPDGWSYEWKRNTIMGATQPAYEVELAQGGWDPVPASRHPELMPGSWIGNCIDREGMRLYERPTVISEESRARDLAKANKQVRDKEAQISGAPAGTFERENKGERLAKIKKTYEYAVPLNVPKVDTVPERA